LTVRASPSALLAVYDRSGNFLSGSLADSRNPSARNPASRDAIAAYAAWRQGLGGGQLHEHARCIANEIADALAVQDIALPMTPGRLHALT
jgi:hypothetical protein